MARFTVQVTQYVAEVAEIVVEADSEDAARALVQASIDDTSGLGVEYDFDVDWEDGDGIHDDGVTITMVERRT
jgi:hypothetical protein